jgi:hypothetical protein
MEHDTTISVRYPQQDFDIKLEQFQTSREQAMTYSFLTASGLLQKCVS